MSEPLWFRQIENSLMNVKRYKETLLELLEHREDFSKELQESFESNLDILYKEEIILEKDYKEAQMKYKLWIIEQEFSDTPEKETTPDELLEEINRLENQK